MSGEAPRSLADWLRKAWADPAAGCPPPEAWLAEEQAALRPEQRERLAAHLAGCPACQAERGLAEAFDAGEAAVGHGDVDWVVARLRGGSSAPPAAGPPGVDGSGNEPLAPVVSMAERRRRTRSARWMRLAAAAAVVLGIGLAVQTLYVPGPPAPPAERVARGGSIEAVAPVGEVGELPRELRWKAVPEARAYRIRVETAAGDSLWQGEAPGAGDMTARIDLPEETRARMRRAVTYRWTVQALDARGNVLAGSEPVTFRAAPEPEPPQTPENGEHQP